MIFYYTATGNSLYVAKQLDPNPISIPQAMKGGNLTFEDDAIGIVYPVFVGDMPALVKEFLAKATFKTDYFFVVATYGNFDSAYASIAKRNCKKCGIDLAYAASILMVDNYLPVFDIEEQLQIDKDEDGQIARVKQDIAERRRFVRKEKLRVRFAGYMFSSSKLPNPLMRSCREFAVSGDCTGCGVCRGVCPRGNITISGGRPEFGAKCDCCLACVHACPQYAIKMARERNPKRHYRKGGILLEDIIAANRQK